MDGRPVTRRVNLEKVLRSLSITCPFCGYAILPAEIRRTGFETMRCPKCEKDFDPAFSPARTER
jgi:hypothetical protein